MSSAQPAAIHAFLDIATSVLPSDSVVHFGKPLPEYIAPVTLQVTGTQNGRQEPAEMSPEYRREEEFDIIGQLVVAYGDDDEDAFLSRMDETFANFALITVAVANNPTMTNTVRYAAPNVINYTPDATIQGWAAGILDFSINCQVRITSLT